MRLPDPCTPRPRTLVRISKADFQSAGLCCKAKFRMRFRKEFSRWVAWSSSTTSARTASAARFACFNPNSSYTLVTPLWFLVFRTCFKIVSYFHSSYPPSTYTIFAHDLSLSCCCDYLQNILDKVRAFSAIQRKNRSGSFQCKHLSEVHDDIKPDRSLANPGAVCSPLRGPARAPFLIGFIDLVSENVLNSPRFLFLRPRYLIHENSR